MSIENPNCLIQLYQSIINTTRASLNNRAINTCSMLGLITCLALTEHRSFKQKIGHELVYIIAGFSNVNNGLLKHAVLEIPTHLLVCIYWYSLVAKYYQLQKKLDVYTGNDRELELSFLKIQN